MSAATFDKLLREAFKPLPVHRECKLCKRKIKHHWICDDCREDLR